ncbi:MAG: helicase c2 [Spirochaetes bacterium]|nr:helicase c2 [Spirochaetota bacterium]
MRADRRLAPEAIEAIRLAIGEAGGNEVFLVGIVGGGGLVESVKVGARGSDEAVPVLRPHLRGGDVVLHNHPGGPLAPSRADLAIASRLGDEGIGFYIVDNRVDEVYVVAEPVTAREVTPLDRAALARALEPGGALNRLVPWFEERPSQVGMLRAVCDAFNGDGILAVEAGTGVGKSLAYLLPALAWAARNGERVVVSTNTINLQQQLMEKDIPLVKRILAPDGLDPRVALVKGRGNYLCLHRLAEAAEETTLFEEPDGELAAIGDWALTTSTGDRTDLSFFPSDEIWSRVCSEPDACHGLRCSRREGCFVLRARREASAAVVLVANHHLLFADLAFRMDGGGFEDPAVLPPYRRVIFDEAHNVEKAATSFFSRSFNRFSLTRYLNRLHRRRKGKVVGLVPMLAKLSGHPLKGVPGLIAAVREAADGLDERCIGLMGEEGSFLLEPGSHDRFLEETGSALADLSAAIRSLAESLTEAAGLAAAKNEKETENLAWEVRVQLNRLSEAAGIADLFRAAEIAGSDVYWMETLRGRRTGGERGPARPAAPGEPARGAARLVITPLDIGPLMREAVYEPLSTVVFTSATLTVADSFAYWAGRIGLDARAGREVSTGVFPSPFDYRSNVLLGVPTDAPAPDAPGYRGFLARFLGEALAASRGGALVLFTSRALLREMHEAVAPSLAGLGIRILRQGEDDRARLLDRFRDEASSVLFATDSFWEGVDAPGETLHAVVLCRLPFRVPSEPVLKARMAAIEAGGGNPFTELSLPDAVVRMRQGFGRLMRRRDDRGVVLVLDSRIVTKRYGQVFFDSLPGARRLVKDSSDLIAGVTEFFGG